MPSSEEGKDLCTPAPISGKAMVTSANRLVWVLLSIFVAAIGVLACLVYVFADPGQTAARNWAMVALVTASAVAIGSLPLAAILVRALRVSNDVASDHRLHGPP
jgi:hypothetical protein